MNKRNRELVTMTQHGRKRLEREGKIRDENGTEKKFLDDISDRKGSVKRQGSVKRKDFVWRTDISLAKLTGISTDTIRSIRIGNGVTHTKLLEFFRAFGLELSFELESKDYVYVIGESERPGNLPIWDHFIGREEELTTLLTTLGTEQSRLTILTGLSGCGKSRLSVALGQRVMAKFNGRVWFIELLKVTEAEKIEQLIRTELRLPDYQQLEEALGAETTLLILDNCEQFLETCKQLIQRLLSSPSCPRLHILATSREAFWAVAGQVSHPMKGLKKEDAIRLFLERYKEQGFVPKEEDKPAILNICASLDYSPLGIEQAAALAPMPPQEIETMGHTSFHAAIHAAIGRNYDLLSEKGRKIFRCLWVFKGGWTAEAALAICAPEENITEIQRLMGELTKKSLIQHERAPESRYRMQETLREYAATKITDQENDRVLKSHKQYFVEWAQKASRHLEGKDGVKWIRLIDAEYPNLRAAMTLSLDEAAFQDSLSLCGALQGYWGRRGFFAEGLEFCRQILAKANGSEHPKERAKVLNAAGGLAYFQSDWISAREFYQQSLEIRLRIDDEIDDELDISDSYNNIGLIDYEQGRYAAALTNYNLCLEIRLKLGNQTAAAYVLMNLGMVYHAQGDYATAQTNYDDSHSRFQNLKNPEGIAYKNPEGIAYVDTNRGWMALIQQKYERAKELLELSRLFFIEETGDPRSIAEVDNALGLVSIAEGEYFPAWSHLKDSLTIRRDIGDKKGIVEALEAFAALAAVQDQRERADDLWNAADMHRQSINIPLPLHKQNEYKAAMGKVAFHTDRTRQGKMTLTQAIEYALNDPIL